MIEFTLEELEIINTAVSRHEKMLYGNENETRFTPILRKIGRMIEDYDKPKLEPYMDLVLSDGAKVKCTGVILGGGGYGSGGSK